MIHNLMCDHCMWYLQDQLSVKQSHCWDQLQHLWTTSPV